MIISAGIATEDDIRLAIEACRKVDNDDIILLKTASQYPAKIENSNLLMIPDIAKRFNTIVGISDHTLGITVPIVATTLGAKVIEKHFILDKSIGGVDSSFSLDEKEFTKMVNVVRNAEKSLGKIDYALSKEAKKSREFSRSLYVVKDIKKGDFFTEENVKSIRPGYGLHPKYYNDIIGMKANVNMEKGTPLNFSLLSD